MELAKRERERESGREMHNIPLRVLFAYPTQTINEFSFTIRAGVVFQPFIARREWRGRNYTWTKSLKSISTLRLQWVFIIEYTMFNQLLGNPTKWYDTLHLIVEEMRVLCWLYVESEILNISGYSVTTRHIIYDSIGI
jgi:hypothetical protein